MSEIQRVEVGGGLPSAADVLDYAAALIEAFGWNNTKPGAYEESGESQGFTLHDAVGEACSRLSAATEPAAGQRKDWVIQDRAGNDVRLRDRAAGAVVAELEARKGKRVGGRPWQGGSDMKFNDQAKQASEVLSVLEAAKEAQGD
jgi:hypothetical protein